MSKPKIRFKGYCNDWERRKLGDIASSFEYGLNAAAKEYDGENKYIRITDIDDNTHKFLTDNLTSPDIDLTGADNYKLTEGDILFARTGASVGKTYIYRNSDGLVYYAGFLIRARIKEEYDAEFVFQNTLTDRYNKYIAVTSQRSGQPGVNAQEYAEFEINVPQKEEQTKIGTYFRNIDHLITLHQRQCENAKKLKKFMLQKMFPKNGQKNPEIRFDGFTDDWEQRKFSDYYKMSSGCAFKMSDYCEDGIGLINGESIQHGIINDDNLNHLPESFIEQYPDFILKEGDIVVGLNRPITNGNLKIARIPSKYNDSLLYQRAGKVVYKEECDRDFSYVLLSQEILKHTLVEAVGSDQPFISTSKLDKWQMMIPKDIEEQHKIGEYFSNLDNLITLHQRKVDNLKNLKKYMLQNMFV